MPRRPPTQLLSQDERLAKLRRQLKARLRLREMARGPVYVLDLRQAAFAALPNKRLTVFDPASTKWPTEGATTADRETAERWVEEHYAPWLAREIDGRTTRAPAAASPARPATVTVRTACEEYLKYLPKVLGPRHTTVRNRRSALRVHVIDVIGDLPLRAMNQAHLTELLEGMLVRPRGRRNGPKGPPAPRTHSAVCSALQAVWKYRLPKEPCPFSYVPVDQESRVRERTAKRQAIILGQDLTVKESYTYEELDHIILCAMWYDRMVMRLPCMRGRYVPLSPEIIACSTGLGTRISELPLWRWSHLRVKGTIIPGLKNESAYRAAPLPLSMLPWMARLEALRVPGRADAQILRLRRDAENTEHTGKKLYDRIANILVFAGLKMPGQATHVFRESYATMARERPDLVDEKSLKFYLGHSVVLDKTTDLYLDLKNLERRIANIPDAHRQFVRLPAPDALEKRLRGWAPPTYQGGTLTEELERLRGEQGARTEE